MCVCVCVCVCVATAPRSRSGRPWVAVAPHYSTLFCSGMARSLAVAHSLTTPLTLRSRSLGVCWLVAVAPMPYPRFIVLFSRLRVRLRQIAPYRMRSVLGGLPQSLQPPSLRLVGFAVAVAPSTLFYFGVCLGFLDDKSPSVKGLCLGRLILYLL